MSRINNLKTAAVVMTILGAVVLMGIGVLEGMADSLKDSTLVSDETLSSVLIGTAESLTYDEVDPAQTFVLYNATNSSDTLTEGTHFTVADDAGTISLLTAGLKWNNSDLNATYYYLADTTESQVADTFKVGLAIFATFASIIVLAMVGWFVIGIFSRKK
jgi:hypothetical protein